MWYIFFTENKTYVKNYAYFFLDIILMLGQLTPAWITKRVQDRSWHFPTGDKCDQKTSNP